MERSRRGSFVFSLGVIALGALAVGWGVFLLPVFWQQSSIERISARILAGATFKVETLTSYLPLLEAAEQAKLCRPIAVRSAAILRLHMLEQSIASAQRTSIDDQMVALRDAARRALACSPADSFLWLVLYWVESARDGFSADKLDYLRLSYRLGQNEGWITLKRNRAVLALFEVLPSDLREKALAEFLSLVTGQLYRETVAIFLDQRENVKDQLLAGVSRLEKNHQRAFDEAASDRGYALELPAVERQERRPWH
jgi:hypothetical protein